MPQAVTTNHELADICLANHIPLIGVFNKDEDLGKPTDGGYIINLSDSKDSQGRQLPGTHWTVFWIEKSKCAYFDSFGCPPPQAVQRFLRPFTRYPYCSFTIQNIESSVCGWYCIDFLAFMAKRNVSSVDKRFTAFLDRYSYNPNHNRRLLEGYLDGVKGAI